MNTPLHQRECGELLTIALGLECSIKGQDFFPLTAEEKAAAERRKRIVIRLSEEQNDANRLLLDEESEEHKELIKKIATWVEENPYKCYADRNDSYDGRPEIIQDLLDCKTEDDVQQWYCDRLDEVEENYLTGSAEIERGHYESAWGEVVGYNDFEDDPDLELLVDVCRENDIYVNYDVSDVVDTALRQTDVKIQAIPLLDNNDRIYCPHYEQSDEENRECVRILNRLFKMDLHPMGKHPSGCQSWPDATYPGSFMVFCGTLDLADIIEKRKIPNTIETGTGNYLFFDSSNGSGSGFEPKIRRSVTLRCLYLVDGLRGRNGYGVDETYGFTYSVWREEFSASFREWEPNVQAIYKSASGRNCRLGVKK